MSSHGAVARCVISWRVGRHVLPHTAAHQRILHQSKKKWIGLGENLQEKTILNGKNLWVSCKFSLKPIH
jgi:hypothetical protein